MIAPQEADGIGPLSPTAAECLLVGVEAVVTSRMLDVAVCDGWQDFGDLGRLQYWTLVKPLGKYPAHATLVRETLLALLFPQGVPVAAKYGSAQLVGQAADFAAVEKGEVLP